MAPSDPNRDDEYSIFGPGETVDVPGHSEREEGPSEVSEPKYQDQEWLYHQYAILRKTLQEIADDCGVTEKTIWRWVQNHDIDTRPGGTRPGLWRDEDWLRDQYIRRKKSTA
jgi:hypothetical protein